MPPPNLQSYNKKSSLNPLTPKPIANTNNTPIKTFNARPVLLYFLTVNHVIYKHVLPANQTIH